MTRELPWAWLLWICAGVVLALTVHRQIFLYDNLYTAARDHAFFTQSLWNAIHGDGLRATIGKRSLHLFSEHAYVSHWFLAPFYALWPSPHLLMVIQALALAVSGPALAATARYIGVSRAGAVMLGLLLLAQPSLHGAAVGLNTHGYHPDTLFPLFFLLAYGAWLGRRRRLFYVLFILNLSILEHYAVIWGAVGALWFLRGHRLDGAVVLGVALLWFAVATMLVIPSFSSGSEPYYFSGLSLRLSDPILVETAVDAAVYFAKLSIFFMLLPLGSILVLAVLPMLAIYAQAQIVGYVVPLELWSWHSCAVLPVMGVAAAETLARMEKCWPQRVAVVPVVLAAGVILISAVSTSKVYQYPVSVLSAERRAELYRLEREIPEGASLSATNFVAAHFSNRRSLYHFPAIRDAQYVLVDTRQRWGLTEPDRAALSDLRRSSQYELLSDDAGFELFRRKPGRVRERYEGSAS